MYKVMKEDKIVAVLDTDKVIGLNYDEIIEDSDHTTDDYDQYNGEYLLKSEIPAPTKEEQRIARERTFIKEADPLRYAYEEDVARYGADSEQALTSKAIWLAKKDEIRQLYPYPEGE